MYRITERAHYPDFQGSSFTVSSPQDIASPMIREAVLTCAELGEPVKIGHLFVEPLHEAC